MNEDKLVSRTGSTGAIISLAGLAGLVDMGSKLLPPEAAAWVQTGAGMDWFLIAAGVAVIVFRKLAVKKTRTI